MVKIHTADNLSDVELAKLKSMGLEAKRNNNGGTDITSNHPTMLPKTVTGFFNTLTGEFVAIVLEPVSRNSEEERGEKLVFWRR